MLVMDDIVDGTLVLLERTDGAKLNVLEEDVVLRREREESLRSRMRAMRCRVQVK